MDATPEPFMAAVPMEVLPSKKVTVPVGVPEAAVTAEVRVIAWVVVAGLGDARSDVVVAVPAAALTVSTETAEVEAFRVVFPEYCAVRLCEPAVMDAIWMDATPEPFTAAVPREALPSKKVTVPVGVPEVAVTVEVRVIAWVVVAGFREEVSVVVDAVLAAPLTVTVTALEAPAAYLESPEYVTVIESLPAASVERDSVAAPEAFTTADPMDVPLLENVAVPVGCTVPTIAMAAVRVTDWPVVAGFGVAVRVTAAGDSAVPAAYSSAPMDGGLGRRRLVKSMRSPAIPTPAPIRGLEEEGVKL
jgi:hypothetical protein